MFLELHTELPNHPKIYRLAELLQCDENQAIGIIIRIWCHAAQLGLLDGHLKAWNTRLFEHVSQHKDPQLVDALIDAGFLDRDDDGELWIHNAKSYFAYARRLTKDADRKRQERLKKSCNVEDCEEPASTDNPRTVRGAAQDIHGRSWTSCGQPEPEPEPEPKPEPQKNKEIEYSNVEYGAREARVSQSDAPSQEIELPGNVQVIRDPQWGTEVRAVYEHWRHYHPRANKVIRSKSKVYKLIRARLADDGLTVAQCCDAIDGIHKLPWNLGVNPTGRRYLSPDLIFRDAAKTLDYAEAKSAADKPVPSERQYKAAALLQKCLDNPPGDNDGIF